MARSSNSAFILAGLFALAGCASQSDYVKPEGVFPVVAYGHFTGEEQSAGERCSIEWVEEDEKAASVLI